MKRTLRQLWQVAKTPLRLTLGLMLMLVGILGLLLPILPGWIFIFPGLALLVPDTRAWHWLREKAERVRAKVDRRRCMADEGTAGEEDTSPPEGPAA